MGMPVGIDVCDAAVPEEAVDRAFAWLRQVDATFSTYRDDSEISRLNREELAIEDCSPEVRWVLERCRELAAETGGYFDARATGDGGIDPSGFVKGWSIEHAARLLHAAGARNYCVNGAGDMQVAGFSPDGGPWRVGIQHPRERMAVAAVLELTDGAVATSGAYERGAHVLDPHTGLPPAGVLSTTVVGPGLATTDAYATAAFAMGAHGARWLAERPGHAGLVILDDDTVVTTPAMDRYRATH
jgi:thiamine biosynthesis lipoprotein